MTQTRNNSDFGKLKRMLFGIIGVIIVVGAAGWAASNRLFVSRAETAKGEIVRLNAGGSHPEIKFTARDGKEIEYAQGGLIFGYRAGDEVDVYYDPQNPRNSVVDSFGALWGFPLLAFILGVAFICAALFLKPEN